MELRNFDRAQETLAATWARLPFISPEGWLNERGETIAQATARPDFDANEDQLVGYYLQKNTEGRFFSQNGVRAYAKKLRPLQRPSAKIVGDIGHMAGLPIAPEALVEVAVGDTAVTVALSMVPFDDCRTLSHDDEAHSVATVAMVVDTLFRNDRNGRKHEDCCIDRSSDRAALFDFTVAFNKVARGKEQVENDVLLPNFLRPRDIDPAVAWDTIQRLQAVDAGALEDVIRRLTETRLSEGQAANILSHILTAREALPQIIGDCLVSWGLPFTPEQAAPLRRPS